MSYSDRAWPAIEAVVHNTVSFCTKLSRPVKLAFIWKDGYFCSDGIGQKHKSVPELSALGCFLKEKKYFCAIPDVGLSAFLDKGLSIADNEIKESAHMSEWAKLFLLPIFDLPVKIRFGHLVYDPDVLILDFREASSAYPFSMGSMLADTYCSESPSDVFHHPATNVEHYTAIGLGVNDPISISTSIITFAEKEIAPNAEIMTEELVVSYYKAERSELEKGSQSYIEWIHANPASSMSFANMPTVIYPDLLTYLSVTKYCEYNNMTNYFEVSSWSTILSDKSYMSPSNIYVWQEYLSMPRSFKYKSMYLCYQRPRKCLKSRQFAIHALITIWVYGANLCFGDLLDKYGIICNMQEKDIEFHLPYMRKMLPNVPDNLTLDLLKKSNKYFDPLLASLRRNRDVEADITKLASYKLSESEIDTTYDSFADMRYFVISI